jgi:hypothetical protein
LQNNDIDILAKGKYFRLQEAFGTFWDPNPLDEILAELQIRVEALNAFGVF